MKVAVLGGGPAGAFAAERLAGFGVETLLFDEKLAWEKPCGGGLTFKAYSQYPFLKDGMTVKKSITESVLAAPDCPPTTLQLDRPILIYSRYDLNSMLLTRAEYAGAEVIQTRVLSAKRTQSQWHLQTKAGGFNADFCIVATGARNPLRDFGTALKPADAMLALGYYAPGDRDRIDLQFLPGLEGYIWVFPRHGHMSVGICGKGEPAASLKQRLHKYMNLHGLSYSPETFYSHLLPALDTPAWSTNRVAGDGWIAVGDAAGLVDPITGEGLYYALRSAELAAGAVLQNEPDFAYRHSLRTEITEDLEYASRLAGRVFRGTLLRGSIPRRMVQFTNLSPTFRAVIQDLFAGTQPYRSLKLRLLKQRNSIARELVWNFVLKGFTS